MNNQQPIHYCYFISLLLLSISTPLHAADTEFYKVYQIIKNDTLNNFPAQAKLLHNHILYPYLRYHYFKRYPNKANDKIIRQFITNYNETPLAQLLRRHWLKYLAKNKRWHSYLKFYEASDRHRTQLHCYQLRAKLQQSPQQHKQVLSEALELWLVGKSQPKACDPIFHQLKQKNYLTQSRYWQRTQLALKKRQLKLSTYLSKSLDPLQKQQVKNWHLMRKTPAKQLATITTIDSELTQQQVVYGYQRLARKDPKQAYQIWQQHKHQYHSLDPDKQQQISNDIALRAARQHLPESLDWLNNIPQQQRTSEASKWLVLSALRQQNWNAVLQHIAALDAKQQQKPQWRYWQARALQQTGKTQQANTLLQPLATQTDYYGFLAADQLKQDYVFNHQALKASPQQLKNLLKLVGVARAKALFDLKLKPEARREWHHVMRGKSKQQLQSMAALAQSWGWQDRAIVSSARAKYFSDLTLRFPLNHLNIITSMAQKYRLDPAWIYGVTRTESIFTEDIRSPAGAIGLMQLMPNTAKYIAKKRKIRLRHSQQLILPKTNLELGSAYLRYVLDKFKSNLVLATAAYNAGPTRAKRWQAKLPADIWVDTIPYHETRDYLHRVMSYSTIYAYRLQQKILPLSQRMAAID